MTDNLNEISPIGERIRAIIKYYKLNKNSFSKILGLNDNSLINRIVNDPNRGTSLDMIQKIAINFPDISLKWLILEKGNMVAKGGLPDPEYHYIKYFKGHNSEPADLLRVHGYDDCDSAFDVFGDIMAPKYRAGDIIICKEIKEPSTIQNGEAYLIIARSVPSIRYIKSETDDGYKLGAESGRVEESIVRKENVDKLYMIKGVIRREAY